MYYCLNENYVLRGWEKLGTGIVEKGTGRVIFVKPDFYAKIRDRSWMLFEGSPFMTPEEKEFMPGLIRTGIVYLDEQYRPLAAWQRYRRYPNRYIEGIHWAMTGRCNCRCRHCYMSAPHGALPEYSTAECLNIIDQMEEAGVQTVSLTGGEALVRPDFTELITRITEAGIGISMIMSNGLLVREPLLTKLEELGQKPVFNMSFDGIGCHDWLRGLEGAEESVIRAFRLCKERGFRTESEYCLHKGNLHAFRESMKLLGELGCGRVKVNGLREEGECIGIKDYILPVEEEYRFYLDYIPQYFEDGEPVQVMLAGMFVKTGKNAYGIPSEKLPEDRDCSGYCLCGHARNWMHITPDGYIVPCIPVGNTEAAKKYFPNISSTTIPDALQDSAYMRFISTTLKTYFEYNPMCSSCAYRNRCAGGCRGNAALCGDMMGRDQKACAFFKGGWYDKTKDLLAKWQKTEHPVTAQ